MIINQEIDHGKGFDWGLASRDYAKFRDIYPEAFYQKIVDLDLCVSGQKVLDLGTGTGVLPRNMAKYGAKFVGADISENQIAQAIQLSKNAGLDIEYVVASAENFDFPNKTFDVVTACQCFMYFDKAAALPKIHDVLKDNGHFAVLFMAWLPDESEIAKASEDLVLKYNPSWTGGGLKRYKIGTPNWLNGMFEVEHAFTDSMNVSFTREAWHGRMKACRGIGASSLSAEEIAAWEKEHLAYLETQPEVFDIPHFVSILDLRKI
jgi:Methylase involved in ubiquinone/menaquinone biosynthesis